MNIHNQLPFASRIEFVPENEFNLHNEGKPEVGFPWFAEDCVTSESAWTKKAYACSAGGVQNGNKVFLFHLHPDLSIEGGLPSQSFTSVKEKFNQEIDTLKKQNKELNGLLTGGAVPKDNTNFKKSPKLFKKLKKLLSDYGAKMSIIWGHKTPYKEILIDNGNTWKTLYNGTTNVSYSAIDDTWRIHHSNINPINTVDDLKNSYKIIKISDNDQLFIRGKEIKKSEHPELFYENEEK